MSNGQARSGHALRAYGGEVTLAPRVLMLGVTAEVVSVLRLSGVTAEHVEWRLGVAGGGMPAAPPAGDQPIVPMTMLHPTSAR